MDQSRDRKQIVGQFKDLGHPAWHSSGCAAEGCPVYATHIVRGPSVALLYLGHQWGGCRRCADRLFVSGRDCVVVDRQIGTSPWYKPNRSVIVRVHLIVGAGFVIRIHIELSFQEEVTICCFVVLVTFDMAGKRHDMHFCTGGGDSLYYIKAAMLVFDL